MRRTEIVLAVALFVALAAAALIGRRAAPDKTWEDRRASTYLAGPYGAKGLAETLRRLGVQVRQRRRPLFDLADEPSARTRPRSGAGDAAQVVAFLDIAYPTVPEIQGVRAYVARGGRVFIAGSTRIELCFGFDTRRVAGERWTAPEESLSVVVPDAAFSPPPKDLPAATRVMVRVPPESLYTEEEEESERCPSLYPTATDTLLATGDGRPVALALRFRGGGRATLLADVVYVSNRALKETDAGLVVVPWILEGGTERVVVDEYHQGFGEGAGLFGAALRWVVAAPAGWALLQLTAVALVALAVAAVRFGPALNVIERRRRSPLEHLEA
ncbi:MAG: DUF4350 domain-containing protein, partial [Gemmatimonadales bacterium]